MSFCSKSCNTCTEIYCPWRFDWKEARAEREIELGHFKDFATVEDLILDLHKE